MKVKFKNRVYSPFSPNSTKSFPFHCVISSLGSREKEENNQKQRKKNENVNECENAEGKWVKGRKEQNEQKCTEVQRKRRIEEERTVQRKGMRSDKRTQCTNGEMQGSRGIGEMQQFGHN